jgi:hypothetical protein
MPKHAGAETMKDRMGGMHHPAVPSSFGPELVSEPITFPRPGLYQVWAQIKHGGSIVYAGFMVDIAAGR